MFARTGRAHAARGGGFRRGYGGGGVYGLGYGYGGGSYGYDNGYDDGDNGIWGYGSCTWVGPLRICP